MENTISTYGLVGYPVKHSLSPCMHNTAFRALGLDAEYKLFSLREDELAPFFDNLRKPDNPIFGLNVTVPYKESVLKYMDSLSPFARKIGAVNTIVIDQHRKLAGHNTDGPGFLAHLAELDFLTQGKRVSILGAGGAARAILSSLCLIPKRPESIRIYDIDYDKANFFLEDLSKRFDVGIVKIVRSIDDLNVELSDLLINATPIGMKGDGACLVEPELLHSDMLVYDLIYNPPETALLKFAREMGAKGTNGLGMLFYQGVLAFQHWAEVELSDEVKNLMRRSLEEGEVL